MLELISITIFIWLGFSKFKFPFNICIGILLPAAFIFLWSAYISPGSPSRSGHFIRFIIELTIFISAFFLLSLKLSLNLGISYLIFAIANNILTHWGDIWFDKQ
ncbi:DUF2568 domain-containing protein [Apibacter raozihei]|nr:DUF2568 domain-containing protein [Apibacter sp. HY039]